MIRQDMKEQYAVDSELHNVEVNAPTIEEALNDASLQLDVKTTNLQYEVLEKGSDGFLGIGKKPWKLKIYQDPNTVVRKSAAAGGGAGGAAGAEEVKIESKDAIFYVRHFDDGIFLKVIPPVGEGQAVDKAYALDTIKRPDTISFDESLIDQYIKDGTDGEYKQIGKYKHISGADAVIAVDVSKDEMHGTIIVDAPSMSGADASSEQIINALKAQGVLAGINEEKVAEFVDNPIYSAPFEVASAILPIDGTDSYFDYKFETDMTKLKAKESDQGNVDFKELNRIQNVVKGQVLAVHMEATRGKGGKTLYSKYLEAKNGKDIPYQLGTNVEFGPDGKSVIASIDGQVLLVNNKITVEPMLNLDAVNIKSGNINFLGTVIIRGNVEDGFNVKASGDIDIGGTVGKCNLESDGNIIVHQGVFGKNEGSIKCGKSLWVKFVQDMKIEVEENVIATDSLMNCSVSAMKNIVVYGKKAQITGGELFATEEICARTVGSAGGGATTTLTVGVDPRAKRDLDALTDQQNALVKELENIDLDISTLENQRKMRRTLSKEKEENLEKLMNRKNEIISESEELNGKISELQDHLRDLKAVGKIKVEGTVYPGTKIYVRDVLDDIHSEVKACTFYYEDAFAKRSKYEKPSLDVSKGPEGYN